MKTLTFALLLARFAWPQNDTGAVSGIVRELSSGQPVPDAEVAVGRTDRNGKTDAEGRYSILNVPAGQQRVTATAPRLSQHIFPRYVTKMVTVAPGQEAAGVDFGLEMPGSIAGRILDQNREPMPGIQVVLVAREYSLGSLRYVYSVMATTDDDGAYVLHNVRPGRAFLLMARKRERKMDAISPAPVDPKLRKPAFAPTFYPGTPQRDGAQLLTLRAGEQREGVDLRILRSPSYCAEGVVQAGAGPQAFPIQLEDVHASSGASGDGATFIMPTMGNTGDDGKVRLCNLAPGEYRLTVSNNRTSAAPTIFATASFTIVDRDLRNLTVVAKPVVAVAGEVTWHGEAPDPPLTQKLTVGLEPLTRAPWRGEMTSSNPSIPGSFAMPSVLADAYRIRLNGLPNDIYLKEMTYGGVDVRTEPLLAGSVADSTLRIVLARDGGNIAAKVADKDGNAVGDARVLVLPITVPSEAALAATIVSGQCDQVGVWNSNALAPGKYYVLALARPHDNSPESIGKLWGSRTHFKEIDIAPKSSVQVTLAPMDLN
ncbi:MAG TPA: carboxypeptidase-like regulatory domain-containing protein [Bryobacteraceae bacterium]|nr:carboxypeptidase-like regulatory domain-containing protein [Bryobacteraceae bacterium]